MVGERARELDKKGRLVLSGRELPWGVSECSASAPLRESRPLRCVGATALETADAHAHGRAHAPALANARHPRWPACDPTRADEARADRSGGGGTSHRGMRESELATDLDTKKPGVRAAPPGESLFSSLFSVAARGGKSPRESVVTVSLEPLAHRVKSLEPRRSRASSRHAMAERTLFPSLSSSSSLPGGRHARSHPHGDLTVTTRPGVVVFYRATLPRFASPSFVGEAPCGAVHGAKLQSGKHT
jgi:hypothetical protein